MKIKILLLALLLSLVVTGCKKAEKTEEPGVVVDSNVLEPTESPKPQPVEKPNPPEVGKPAPDFTLVNLEGEEKSLSDYKGSIVYLNFWATWCGYCDREMPDLNSLNENNEDLVVLTVNVGEDKKTVQEYMNKGEYTMEVLLDEKGEIASMYYVNGLPNTYFIDKEGVFLDYYPGMMTGEDMQTILGKIRALEK